MRKSVDQADSPPEPLVPTGTPPHWGDDLAAPVGVARRPQRMSIAVTAAPLLADELGLYVRENAPYQLTPGDARRVASLFAAGAVRAALWLYFDSAGTRWDREWPRTTSRPASTRRHS